MKIFIDVANKLPETVNTSPVTLVLPVIRIQYGCGQGTVYIPGSCVNLHVHLNWLRVHLGTCFTETILIVEDADGEDIIKCRWAQESNQECGDVCRRLSENSLDRLQVRWVKCSGKLS